MLGASIVAALVREKWSRAAVAVEDAAACFEALAALARWGVDAVAAVETPRLEETPAATPAPAPAPAAADDASSSDDDAPEAPAPEPRTVALLGQTCVAAWGLAAALYERGALHALGNVNDAALLFGRAALSLEGALGDDDAAAEAAAGAVDVLARTPELELDEAVPATFLNVIERASSSNVRNRMSAALVAVADRPSAALDALHANRGDERLVVAHAENDLGGPVFEAHVVARPSGKPMALRVIGFCAVPRERTSAVA